MTGQFLSGRRIGDIGSLRDKISALLGDVNTRQRGVDWHLLAPEGRRRSLQWARLG